GMLSRKTADAQRALDTLQARGASEGRDLGFGGNLEGRPTLAPEDVGFAGLASLYSKFIQREHSELPRDRSITHFVDACALVPDKRGYANMVVAQWSDGHYTQTSYEELREIISKEFDRAIWPVQLSLFIVGVLVHVGTIAVTHFPTSLTNRSSQPLAAGLKG